MKTLIKRANGSTRGYTIESGERKIVYSPAGQTLGWYSYHQLKTFKSDGSPIGNGDQTVLLLEE